MAIATFPIIVYAYYRFINCSFIFWGYSPYFVWMDLLLIPYILLWVEKLCYKVNAVKDEGKQQVQVEEDSPITDPENDEFEHLPLVKNLLNNLQSLNLTDKAYSVGIVGEWGQGKTSFLNLLAENVSDKGILVRFNPRSVKSVDKIQEDFFNSFSAELEKYHTGVKRYICEYAKAIEVVDCGWIGKVVNLVVASLTSTEYKTRINKAIEKIGRRIYVIVEDLDRLTGEEIIEVLKLIDGNGDFRNTIFLSAYDKQYVNEILNHYLGTKLEQNFTDKYFCYEIPLPVQTPSKLSSYFRNYLKNYIQLDKTDLLDENMMMEIWNKNGSFIISQLKTMRNIKRFINLFMYRYLKVKNNVDLHDYLLVTLLQYNDICTYTAISDGRLLSKDEEFNYLINNIKDVLKSIDAKESSEEILHMLFPDKNLVGSIPDIYDKVRLANSIGQYFFDYKTRQITYEEGMPLLSVKEDKDAFAKVDEYIDQGYQESLSDFLRSRNYHHIGNIEELCRLFKLVTYLDNKQRTDNLESYMEQFFLIYEISKYEKVNIITDRELYKNRIKKSIIFMLDYASKELGFLCQNLILDILGDNIIRKDKLLSLKELVELAESAQKKYYQKWGTKDCLFDDVLMLTDIKVSKGDQASNISSNARAELKALMYSHASEFVSKLVEANVNNQNGKMLLSLSFNKNFKSDLIFDAKLSPFEEWLEKLNTKERKIIVYIYLSSQNFVQVPAIKDHYEQGDFEGFYEAVKKDEEDTIDRKVLTFMEGRISIDIKTLANGIGTDNEVLRASIIRLVSKKKLPENFEDLKLEMEAFEVGDFVRILDSKFDGVVGELRYSNNIFEIKDIMTEKENHLYYKFNDIDDYLSENFIEAIPMDGVHDKDIYYDSIVAGSLNPSGKPKSFLGNYTYYIDSFKNVRFNDKNLEELVKKANCQFVHEVQHYLADKFRQKHDLKILHILKSEYRKFK